MAIYKSSQKLKSSKWPERDSNWELGIRCAYHSATPPPTSLNLQCNNSNTSKTNQFPFLVALLSQHHQHHLRSFVTLQRCFTVNSKIWFRGIFSTNRPMTVAARKTFFFQNSIWHFSIDQVVKVFWTSIAKWVHKSLMTA